MSNDDRELNPAAVALGKLRWRGVPREQLLHHMQLMRDRLATRRAERGSTATQEGPAGT